MTLQIQTQTQMSRKRGVIGANPTKGSELIGPLKKENWQWKKVAESMTGREEPAKRQNSLVRGPPYSGWLVIEEDKGECLDVQMPVT